MFVLIFPLLILCWSREVDVVVPLNQFGMEIYNEISKMEEFERKNVVYSPYSMYSVLGMLLGACDGNSRSQLTRALHLSDYSEDEESVHVGLSLLMKSLQDSKKVRVSHGLFMSKNFKILKSYVDFVKSKYCALVDRKVFPEPGTSEINSWVEKKTKGMIKNFLPPLSEDTRAVLINTIHFKNDWLEPFVEQQTRERQFSLIDEEIDKGSFPTAMMKNEKQYFYGEHSWNSVNFKTVDLSFMSREEQTSKFGMLFLLPTSNENTLSEFQKLEATLVQKNNFLKNILEEQTREQVILEIPRFLINWKGAIHDLLERKFGVTDIFDPFKADFSKLVDSDASQNRLKVDSIIQQAKIVVDENGCEAAAASAVVIVEMAYFEPQHFEKREFKANRPFLYLIYHKPSKSVLFMGKVLIPAKWGDKIVIENTDNFDLDIQPVDESNNNIISKGAVNIYLLLVTICLAILAILILLVFLRKYYRKEQPKESENKNLEFVDISETSSHDTNDVGYFKFKSSESDES